MTDIYSPEGVLDYAAAAAELHNAKSLSNDARAGHSVNRVAAAALLDIAVSLNRITLLAEGAEFPLGSDAPEEDAEGRGGPTVDDPDDGEGEREVDELDIGDRVVVTIAPDIEAAGVIRALGQSEGDDWAEVAWDVDEGEADHVTRVWLRELRREPIAEPGEDEPDARDMVERDLDADFGEAKPVQCGAYEGTKDDPTLGPCIRKPGHKSTKHRDADGAEWETGASDA